MRNVKALLMVIGILGLSACGKAPASPRAAPELMSTLSCSYEEPFPSAQGVAVKMILTQNTYADGSIKSTCLPQFAGFYINIDCSTNKEINYTFVNYKLVSGQPIPFFDNSGSIAIDTTETNCRTSYTEGTTNSAPIVPKH